MPIAMQRCTDRIVAFRDARDWSQCHGLKDEALSLLIEAGGLAEHRRQPLLSGLEQIECAMSFAGTAEPRNSQ